MDKSVQEDDRVFDYADFKIVITKDLDGQYNTLQIDYTNSFLGRGFTISEKGRCSADCC